MSDNGVNDGVKASQPILMLLGCFTAIAWYNVIELNIMIWFRFKRHKGMYFWSLCVSSWGIALHALAVLARFFVVWKNNMVSVTLVSIGWYCMVTGQSLVLYSRLHLVMRDTRKVRWVLYMIIVDVFLFHFPTTVLIYGANSAHADLFLYPFSVMEKIQVTAFATQETIISALYVYYTWKMIRPGAIFQKANARRVMRHLLRINLLIIVMDLTLLGTEFANHYEIQSTYKSALYSIKLKLEFAILNQLVALTRSTVSSLNQPSSGYSGRPSRSERGGSDGGLWGMTGPQGIEPPVKTYTVSASTSSPSTRVKAQYDDVVMKTIDVEVTVSDPGSSARRSVDDMHYGDECSVKGPRTSVASPMSEGSELEFITGSAYLSQIDEVPPLCQKGKETV